MRTLIISLLFSSFSFAQQNNNIDCYYPNYPSPYLSVNFSNLLKTTRGKSYDIKVTFNENLKTYNFENKNQLIAINGGNQITLKSGNGSRLVFDSSTTNSFSIKAFIMIQNKTLDLICKGDLSPFKM